ncbi:hypothetical protein M0638_03650 [Roseomonas sp. NAR14]|uniref:Uncharacterized protein n=1 Tax=Roseomonas acroporae TaxID=2937791 RepID=A0A9X2BTS6_9PROT|nr:hypothetical protein [Roseomonas acroporae]
MARSAEGALTYAIPLPPDAMPPVRARDLLLAWDAARAAASAQRWGPPRRLVFRLPDGDAAEIAIVDEDARCWAEAVDDLAGLDTPAGLALCLRLLALVEVMSRAAWLAGLFDLTAGGGIELHPALLRAAAELPLDPAARFDESALRHLLSRRLPSAAPAAARPTPISGASA